MKKCVLVLLVLLMCLAVPVNAAMDADPPSVVDKSGLLTDSEAAVLETELDIVGARHGIDLVVLTVDSLDGYSAMTYADDYYDHNGYGEDGVLLLVSMGEREWWISTAGECIWAVDDRNISDDFLPYLSAGNYYAAFSAFADSCDWAMTYASDYDGYDGYDDYDTGTLDVWDLVVCVPVAAVIGLIVVAIMSSGMKTVRRQSGARSYVCDGSMKVTASSDRFLYQNTTRTAKPQNTSGGGSGGVHRSSSGRSHGGGGGRF